MTPSKAKPKPKAKAEPKVSQDAAIESLRATISANENGLAEARGLLEKRHEGTRKAEADIAAAEVNLAELHAGLETLLTWGAKR